MKLDEEVAAAVRARAGDRCQYCLMRLAFTLPYADTQPSR